MQKRIRLFEYFGIRQRLLLTYILLITIPMSVLGIRYFLTTKDYVSNIIQQNLHETVMKNNQIIDSKLEQIKEYSLGFVIDPNLSELLSKTYDLSNAYEMYRLDQQITNILNKYFLASPDVYSVRLATHDYTFGNGLLKDYTPKHMFNRTKLYSQALAAEGKLTWVPTYDFAEAYHQPEMKNVSIDYRHMFSAVKLMNSGTLKFKGLHGEIIKESPILVVNFNDNFYDRILKNNIPIKQMYYFIVTQEGNIVSHEDKTMLGTRQSYPWLEQMFAKGSGEDIVDIDGKQMMVLYDISKITGWASVYAVEKNFLVQDAIAVIKKNVFAAILVLVLVFLSISYLLSGMIARPIHSLIAAIKKMERGNFNVEIPVEGSFEFVHLIHKFNSMNKTIQDLIEENYKVVIMKKEAEIKALNLQLNPHFMYNTLNIINLKLIRNGQDETSELITSLSDMLKYSLNSNDGLVPFAQDMKYTQGYIHIMSKRFEGKFEVDYDMDPRLDHYSVPKFMLQPLVENALIHGFKEMNQKGKLSITGWIESERRYFCIEDNGIGMSEEKLLELLDSNPSSIGVHNVRNRIRMIYGEEYDIQIHSALQQGTKITICLPI